MFYKNLWKSGERGWQMRGNLILFDLLKAAGGGLFG